MSTHLGAARQSGIFARTRKTAVAKHRKSVAKSFVPARANNSGEVPARSAHAHAAARATVHMRKAEPSRAAVPSALVAHKRALAAVFALFTALALALSWVMLQPSAQVAAQLGNADVVLSLTANSTMAGRSASTSASGATTAATTAATASTAATTATASSAQSATVDAVPAISGAQAFAAQMAAYATAQSAADNAPAATQFAMIAAGHTLTVAAAVHDDDAACQWQVYAPSTGKWVAIDTTTAQYGEGSSNTAATDNPATDFNPAAAGDTAEPAATPASGITCQFSAANLSTYVDTQNGATIRALVTQSGAQYTSEILYVTVEPAITDIPAA